MNPPAYEHVALELEFSAATATSAEGGVMVVEISKRRHSDNINRANANLDDEEDGVLLYRIAQQRKSKLSSPFRPDLEVTHVPTDRVVGTVKIRSMSHARQLLFPRTGGAIMYKDCFKSLQGNGSIHWYLAAPSYDGGNAIVELRRGDKHRTVLCRLIIKGGLSHKNGTIDVMDFGGRQNALDEIIVSTAAEIWDKHGKGQGEENYEKASKQKTVFTPFMTSEQVDRQRPSGQVV